VPIPSADVGPFPEGRDRQEYDRLRRRVLWSMPTGLFVVGSRFGAQRNLMTCNWAMQVATVPKLVAVSVERGSVTRGLIEAGGAFSVSVLPRSERALVRRFVKPSTDVVLDPAGVAVSIQGQAVHEVVGGLPCLASARSWLACEVRHLLRWDEDVPDGAASHVLVIGEVVDAGESEAGPPGESGGEEAGILRMEDTLMNYGG
jgi:flavin reductase (DIM6/NTAB) family NADH-FMN oxidoreductase RutF